jgi:hypothetical protein
LFTQRRKKKERRKGYAAAGAHPSSGAFAANWEQQATEPQTQHLRASFLLRAFA